MDEDEPTAAPVERRAIPGDHPYRADAHAVVVGIDCYADPSIPPLRFARADAEAVQAALVDPAVGRFDPAHVTLLIDEQATRAAILKAIHTLRGVARVSDTVVIYFAGHGAPEIDVRERAAGDGRDDGLEKFLVPHDAERAALYATAIPMDEVQRLFARIRAGSLVFLLDACYSGHAGGRTFARAGVGMRAVNLSDRFLRALAGEGRCVITSCDVNEVSIEPEAYGHGLFTYFLVEGMRGAAADTDDGVVTVDALYRYLSREVPDAAARCGARMRPVLTGRIRGPVVLSFPGARGAPATAATPAARRVAATGVTEGAMAGGVRVRDWRSRARVVVASGAVLGGLGMVAQSWVVDRRSALPPRATVPGVPTTPVATPGATPVTASPTPGRDAAPVTDSGPRGNPVVGGTDASVPAIGRQSAASRAAAATDSGLRYWAGGRDDRAAVMFMRGCAGGSADGCMYLGTMYEDGRGGLRVDTARAVALFRQACAGGGAGGCNNLGVKYERGHGVVQDHARAVALYRRACDGGDAKGCRNLGEMYEHGRGGLAANVARAVALYEKACASGNSWACEDLERLRP